MAKAPYSVWASGTTRDLDDEKAITKSYDECETSWNAPLMRLQDEAYVLGLRRGNINALTRFAWWKDGVQYVGSCGTTLAQALAEIEEKG